MLQYTKAGVMVLAAIFAALATALGPSGSGHVTQAEWVNVIIIGIGAGQVYFGPNIPGGQYTKFALAALVAAATTLHTLIGAGGIAHVSSSEWIQVVLAALAALGVWRFPNASVKAAARAAY